MVDSLGRLEVLRIPKQDVREVGGLLLLLLRLMLRTETRVRSRGKEPALTGAGIAMSATNRWNCGFNSLQFHFGPHGENSGQPHPGCFCKRVRNRLKTRELSFLQTQKSGEEYENKGSEVFALDGDAYPSHLLGARESEKAGLSDW